MIALDTECTGLDIYHGARPYFVTTCFEDGTQRFWEWDVNPLTRGVDIPEDDARQIRQLLARQHGGIVGQNIKFDAAALLAADILDWTPLWEITEDTLSASHLLASNQPHDLTALAIQYCGEDIKPIEDRLKEAVIECRRRVQQAKLARKRKKPKPPREDALALWSIAEAGRPDMPSAGKDFWKADMWLPRVAAEYDNLPRLKDTCEHLFDGWTCIRCKGHRYWIVLSEYGNTDSEITLRAWQEMKREIVSRGHWLLYREKIKALPTLMDMEAHGTTYNRTVGRELKVEYSLASDKLARVCGGIALSKGYDLELPKGGRNASLDGFVFDVLKLEPVYNPKAKTDRPAFDAKIAIPYYLDTLPPGSQELEFIKAFVAKGGKDKALDYIDSYESYGIPLAGHAGWLLLHPTYNAAGTKLLRRSCGDPNLQQVGKKKEQNLRRCFGPAPGREWWSFDYRNLELRIPAYEANEPDLIALFERPDDSPFYGSEHLLNFSVVYPEVWEDAIKRFGPEKAGSWIKSEEGYADTWYQWIKNGDFAVGYGAIDRADGLGTADRTFRRPGSQARLQARFARKEAHNRRCIAFAERHGYIETIPDREVDPKHGYPLMVTRNERERIKPTEPLNYRTQGTAGWVTLKAMNRCAPRLREWTAADPCGYWLIMEVHDELVFDFPVGCGPEPWRTNLPKAIEIAALMERSGDDIGVPTPVDIDYHAVNWGSGLTITKDMRSTKVVTGPAGWSIRNRQLTRSR